MCINERYIILAFLVEFLNHISPAKIAFRVIKISERASNSLAQYLEARFFNIAMLSFVLWAQMC